MDLNGIETVAHPRTRTDLPAWTPVSAFVAGGTWLFSEPQPHLRHLVDLSALAWPAIERTPSGLRIGATCTIAALDAFEAPNEWQAARLIPACCNALLGSFKVWNAATVGGNICLALPAAPMLALTVALDGTALVWAPDGSERRISMASFALAAQQTALRPGELLRAIDLPETALRRRAALRQASLTTMGRSAALLLATRDTHGLALTITASTTRPLQAHWPEPSAHAIDAFIAGIPPALWFDDVHGTPAWRRHMTRRLAHELIEELA